MESTGRRTKNAFNSERYKYRDESFECTGLNSQLHHWMHRLVADRASSYITEIAVCRSSNIEGRKSYADSDR